MRKLMGWTVGLLALPLLLVLVAVAKAAKCDETMKSVQKLAYNVGLSDVEV